MSFDFWWWHFAISKEEYSILKPKFMAADAQAKIPERFEETYALCTEDPFAILPKFIPYHELDEEQKQKDIFKNGYIEGELSNEFSLALEVPYYRNIFHELPLNEEDVLAFISLGGTTPISVIYFALLPEIAEMLPGVAGNIILDDTEIDQAIMKVDEIFEELNDEAWDRARRYISICTAGKPSKQDDDTLNEIFRALPNNLRETQKRGKCFASVATHQF